MPRTIAIGDVHACLTALELVLSALDLRPDDTLVTLGDYTDRGPDRAGVLARLIALADQTQLVALMGNHDRMLLDAVRHPAVERDWLACGGSATLASYGVDRPELIPAEHLAFLGRLKPFFETDTHLYVHANYRPKLPLAAQAEDTLYWLSLRESVPAPHISGKVAVLGHTPQQEILVLPHLLAIDTGCVYGGWLTALDVDSGQVWQANQAGDVRRQQLELPRPGRAASAAGDLGRAQGAEFSAAGAVAVPPQRPV